MDPKKLDRPLLAQPVDKYGYSDIAAEFGAYTEACFARRKGMVARVVSSTKGEGMEKSLTQPVHYLRPRALLQNAAALAAAPAGAQPRTSAIQARARSAGAMFASDGAFTTPGRKGHGDGINVYRM